MTEPADTPSTLPPEEAGRLMRLATYASVSVAVSLIVAKLIAWFWTDSVSLLATLIDSTLDAAAAILNMVAVRHALAPADKDHRFGHGKAEALAGLGQAMFIAGSAGFLVLEAFGRFFHPQAPQAIEVGIGVMILSIVATLGLLAVQRHVISKTNSTAIKADSLHYRTDLYVNTSVILALVLAAYGWAGFDALFAIGIGIYILFSAWEIVQHATNDLMDRELSGEERQQIIDLVVAHPEVRGMHDLRTRKSGVTYFIQLHLELDANLLLKQAHKIADEVEASLFAAFPNSEIIIHEDPAGLVEEIPDFAEVLDADGEEKSG
ncbi:MAG: cation diffusion facilitator family transporter [Mariprofundaceae bacterium]|nr:cation diffusion facilitator family transporter [Mariprofundaceae bacterium]